MRPIFKKNILKKNSYKILPSILDCVEPVAVAEITKDGLAVGNLSSLTLFDANSFQKLCILLSSKDFFKVSYYCESRNLLFILTNKGSIFAVNTEKRLTIREIKSPFSNPNLYLFFQ